MTLNRADSLPAKLLKGSQAGAPFPKEPFSPRAAQKKTGSEPGSAFEAAPPKAATQSASPMQGGMELPSAPAQTGASDAAPGAMPAGLRTDNEALKSTSPENAGPAKEAAPVENSKEPDATKHILCVPFGGTTPGFCHVRRTAGRGRFQITMTHPKDPERTITYKVAINPASKVQDGEDGMLEVGEMVGPMIQEALTAEPEFTSLTCKTLAKGEAPHVELKVNNEVKKASVKVPDQLARLLSQDPSGITADQDQDEESTGSSRARPHIDANRPALERQFRAAHEAAGVAEEAIQEALDRLRAKHAPRAKSQTVNEAAEG